ncbi:hypothetical protein J437_LFUL005779 [Ladona fulva]|uniref:Uncharacterized protein n=1 Tax=Ladona fulva TaxID=123851 RepID=A0A8K0K4Z0_LADFU|nr:hypothetical protein J437_LFUL005779 [Ladona fulva]
MFQSYFQLLKAYLKNSTTEKHLNNLALMFIHKRMNADVNVVLQKQSNKKVQLKLPRQVFLGITIYKYHPYGTLNAEPLMCNSLHPHRTSEELNHDRRFAPTN